MTAHAAPTTTVLVIGATGKTGRRVADRLRDRGHAVRAASRSGETPFSWQDRATWAPALAGADAAYVTYAPDLAVPGSADDVSAFARAAADAGLRRLVLLSGRGEPDAQRAEEAARTAFPATTVVRCAWFTQNLSESFLLEPILAGEVALPVGDVREPFVDVDDIADVAVAALLDDRHAGELYELTGPRAITFPEALAEVSRATGREVRFVEVPLDAWAQALAAEGLDDDTVGLLRYLFGEVLDGRNASTADGVQRALGRPPRDPAETIRAAAAAGAWAR